MKTIKTLITVYSLLIITAVVGEIRCLYKAFKCNWEPIGKAEVIYTVSAVSGIGCIVGWINIKDN